MSKRILGALLVAVLVAAGIYFVTRPGDDSTPAQEFLADQRTFESDDWLERACALPKDELVRLWRGHHDTHSEDVTIVPLPPNYSGAFSVTSHSGPWDYLQRVPLVFYGPDQIKPGGVREDPVSLVDVYPTMNALTGSVLDPPGGEPHVNEADVLSVAGDGPLPKLIVTIVWDGVGRNVLERWPGRWPTLERMEADGTSFLNATVGSSPSITPATHATLGTGRFPLDHGVTAIEYRAEDGAVRGIFPGRDPSDLKTDTFGDRFDLAMENEPLVGMLAWKSWHMGMLGHGAQTPGGDHDQLALIGSDHRLTGNPAFYETPDYLTEFPGLEERADELDRSDGEADGKWRGRDPLEQHDNPAWVQWQTDAMIAMLDREGYGTDEVPDLFYTNYKPSDITAHQHNMDSPEMGAAIEAQDAGLERLIDFLDDKVRDYAIIVTADHGNTPPPTRSGGWPVLQGQLEEDVNAEFDVPEGRSLIRVTSAAGPFINRQVAREIGVDAADIARFLNGYTIRDNYAEAELPEGYEERGDENVLAAAFPSDRIGDVLRCRFGSSEPPPELNA
ncbi:MAG TPA: alkaline phosphatase family protein [Actinomycetota bacterium]|nr:alkaline phosphatase family protein [Actinomycetota bacterium]